MKLVEWLARIMVGFGAEWVMWLMIGLSVISVAIMLERAWFFFSVSDNLVSLKNDLQRALSMPDPDEGLHAAMSRMKQSPSAEAAVLMAGLEMAPRGPAAAEEAMAGATAIQRMKLEKRLAYLGTLGNNAPFIGLLGTVIGVVMAFDALGQAAKQPLQDAAANPVAPQAVMSSIAEALVATAIGLAVAIPAVAANNTFQRLTKATLANTEALSRMLLAYLKTDASYVGASAGASPVADAPAPKGKAKPATKRNRDEDEDEDEEDQD